MLWPEQDKKSHKWVESSRKQREEESCDIIFVKAQHLLVALQCKWFSPFQSVFKRSAFRFLNANLVILEPNAWAYCLTISVFMRHGAHVHLIVMMKSPPSAGKSEFIGNYRRVENWFGLYHWFFFFLFSKPNCKRHLCKSNALEVAGKAAIIFHAIVNLNAVIFHFCECRSASWSRDRWTLLNLTPNIQNRRQFMHAAASWLSNMQLGTVFISQRTFSFTPRDGKSRSGSPSII